MLPNYENQSYVLKSTKWMEQIDSISTLKEDKELLVCFMTIKVYRDLLFDPNVHLVNDITPEFINHVMIPDFGLVVVKLRDYVGRSDVQIAYSLLNESLGRLYSADQASMDNNLIHDAEFRINALLACRENLQHAYLYLVRLNAVVERLLATSDVKGNPNAVVPQLEYKTKRPFTETKSKSKIETSADKSPDKHKGVIMASKDSRKPKRTRQIAAYLIGFGILLGCVTFVALPYLFPSIKQPDMGQLLFVYIPGCLTSIGTIILGFLTFFSDNIASWRDHQLEKSKVQAENAAGRYKLEQQKINSEIENAQKRLTLDEKRADAEIENEKKRLELEKMKLEFEKEKYKNELESRNENRYFNPE